MRAVPARSCSREQLSALFEASAWPAFIDADPIAAKALPRVRESFAEHELALLDGDELVAAGWGVPMSWDGSMADLPAGYSETLMRALAAADGPLGQRDCFALCAVQVRSDLGRRGLASAAIQALVQHATDRGLSRVVAPLRPTRKHLYPLTPIEQYAGWRRADGQAFDPWLRLHLRLGAEVLTTVSQSQVFTGTAAEWERWSGLALPATGTYVIPNALAHLELDIDADAGRCAEPGIWVRHC